MVDHYSDKCKEIRQKHRQLNYSVIGRPGSLSTATETITIKNRNPPITAAGATELPTLAAGFGDMAVPGVWWCPSWAETTMISKPRHAAKMAVATALLQKPYLQFGKHQETVDLI
ncbi:hypothetical protein GQ457_04G006760 [Hibiscus cannabinus]